MKYIIYIYTYFSLDGEALRPSNNQSHRTHRYTGHADRDSINIYTNIKILRETGILARGSAPASPGRGEAGPLVYIM